MDNFATLTVQKRHSSGKGANRRLRAAGFIPAVFYTPGGENILVQVPELPLMKIFQNQGRTTIFNVEILDSDLKTVAPALLWDIDFHPTKSRIMHVDFFGVDLEKELKVRVPIEYVGTSKGVKLGGSLQTFFEFMDVLCKPLALPNKLVIDVSDLELGQSLRTQDITLPDGVVSVFEPSMTLVSIVTASAAEDGEEGAAPAGQAGPAA